MQKQVWLAVGAVAVLLVIGTVVFSGRGADDGQKGIAGTNVSDVGNADSMPTKEEGMMKQDETPVSETAPDTESMGKDEMMKEGTTKDDMAKSDGMMKGLYEAYTPEKIARAEQGTVILFFHASWCPSCRGLNASIEQNVDAIPKDVTILKTDYDKETALKKKYGVTYQHTMVQVDKDGNLIKKWSGSPSLDALLSQVQ